MSDTDPIPEKPQIEITGDEDWKARVKAEDAQRDADNQAAQAAAPAEHVDDEEHDHDAERFDDSAASLPPASFFTLLQMLSTQAIVALGMVPTPDGKTVVEVPLAKHFIDLLSVLEEKTKGNLSADESRFLDGTLHELRMAYVTVSRQQRGA